MNPIPLRQHQAVRPNTQRGPSAAQQIALNNHQSLAARLIQALSGVPLEDARAAMTITSRKLDDDEQKARTPVRLPMYLVKKRQHWDDHEIRNGIGRVITVNGNQQLHDQVWKSGQYEPSDILPAQQSRNIVAQAKIDKELAEAMANADRQREANDQARAAQELADSDANIKQHSASLPPPAPEFYIDGADHAALVAHLTAIWSEDIYGPLSDWPIPDDPEALRQAVRQVTDELKAEAA